MERCQLLGFLAILISGFLLMSGCITSRTTTDSEATPTTEIVQMTSQLPPVQTLVHTTMQTTMPTTMQTTVQTPVQKIVLFSDDLSHWQSPWDPVYDGLDGKTFYSDGTLHIRDNRPPNQFMDHQLNKKFNKFVLDVDTKKIDGSNNNYHIVVIRKQDEKNYYLICISDLGIYTIVKKQDGDDTYLIQTRSTQWDYSSYINKDSTNHITIEARDETISLSVNGHVLHVAHDDTFTEGTIGLGAVCLNGDFTEVSFNNLVITQI